MGGRRDRVLRHDHRPWSSSRPTSHRSGSLGLPAGTSCRARPHAATSEASTTRSLPSAAEAAVALLVRLAGATADAGFTDVDHRAPVAAIAFDPAYPSRLAGRAVRPTPSSATVLPTSAARSRRTVGSALSVVPTVLAPRPRASRSTWPRRSSGSRDTRRCPALLPRSVAGRGLTRSQRTAAQPRPGARRRRLRRDAVLPVRRRGRPRRRSALPADDPRRRRPRLVNPISEDEPLLRTTLLPGALTTLLRNVGRGARDAAVFETGLVFGPPRDVGAAGRARCRRSGRATSRSPRSTRRCPSSRRTSPWPSLAGRPASRRGWWGQRQPPTWADAIETARLIAATARRAGRARRATSCAPYHPGRCAALPARRTGRRSRGRAAPAGDRRPRAAAADGCARARPRALCSSSKPRTCRRPSCRRSPRRRATSRSSCPARSRWPRLPRRCARGG